MTNYSDLNTLLLFDLLVDYITLQLNGIDKSVQLKELKEEADKREVGLYDNAFNKALKNHKPLLEIENENYETPEYIEIISKSLDGSEYAVALVSGSELSSYGIIDGQHILFEKNTIPKNNDIILVKKKNNIIIERYNNKNHKKELNTSGRSRRTITNRNEDNYNILGVVRLILKKI